MLSTLHAANTPPIFSFSNVPDDEIRQLETRFGAHHYERLNVVVRQARGSWITDVNGKRYLDCLAAYSAANPGHHHPTIVKALIKAPCPPMEWPVT